LICARSFFDLQLEFAERVSTASDLPLALVLLDYTNLYIRFALGREFDPAHPVWRQYVAGLVNGHDRRDWTYRFYLTRPPAIPWPPVVAAFGCFAYARLGHNRIRLHFQNAETDGRSPLGIECQGRRRADLTALFAHVKREETTPPQVVGASWLYNLDAYRRLFPEPYLATARATRGRFRHMPLWGQFVDRHGEVKEKMARELRERLGRLTRMEDLDACFPLPMLALEAPALEFYDFYGV
jgi:hypothetical protein